MCIHSLLSVSTFQLEGIETDCNLLKYEHRDELMEMMEICGCDLPLTVSPYIIIMGEPILAQYMLSISDSQQEINC